MSHMTLKDLTVDRLHHAVRNHAIAVKDVVAMYLARIDAYDREGPGLNAIITVNPNALEEAQRLDEVYRETGEFVGPLHGVPVVVKDQAETKNLRTTFGSIAFESYVPTHDATAVSNLRKAGAIILGKTNLPDFATAWFSFSSVQGETKNPYDLARDPGGSSSGTGAAIAADLALLGIGEDTGGSIRVPSSFNGLFGLRVTTGMISRTGLSPLVHFQDTAGPMGRTVHDIALLLDALVGYDPTDPFTVSALYRPRAGYTSALSPRGLSGARIGILREAFGLDDNPESAAVNRVVTRAMDGLQSAGATLIDPVTIPRMTEFMTETAMYGVQSKYDLNRFFADRPSAPVRSFEELFESGRFHELLDLFHDMSAGPSNPQNEPGYFRQRFQQEEFRRVVLNVMAAHQLDAILCPDVQVLPPTKQELYAGKWTTLTFPTNTLIASQTSLPAISMPGGLTDKGLPVGVELIAKPYDEAHLLRMAYAYEYFVNPRQAPKGFPSLKNEA